MKRPTKQLGHDGPAVEALEHVPAKVDPRPRVPRVPR